MEKEQNVVLVFASVHYTLEAENCLLSAKLPFLVIPVPPAVNEGCGLGIKVALLNEQKVVDFLAGHNIKPIKKVII